jgi:transposase
LAELGVNCQVIAPTLAPRKAGDWVKTDRRDAERLARSYLSGDLTVVWVPGEGSASLRDLLLACGPARRRTTGKATATIKTTPSTRRY